MTTAEFQSRFPKPWRFVICKSNFSLRAANGEIVATLGLTSWHNGVPQIEWNRLVAAALNEHIPCVEEQPQDRVQYAEQFGKALNAPRPAAQSPAGAPPPAKGKVSATRVMPR